LAQGQTEFQVNLKLGLTREACADFPVSPDFPENDEPKPDFPETGFPD